MQPVLIIWGNPLGEKVYCRELMIAEVVWLTRSWLFIAPCPFKMSWAFLCTWNLLDQSTCKRTLNTLNRMPTVQASITFETYVGLKLCWIDDLNVNYASLKSFSLKNICMRWIQTSHLQLQMCAHYKVSHAGSPKTGLVCIWIHSPVAQGGECR
jgi:hypothetical protein